MQDSIQFVRILGALRDRVDRPIPRRRSSLFASFLCQWARILCFVCGTALAAEAKPNAGQTVHEYVVDAWETEDGLPQNTIKTILQTGDGYLWLGTFDGLVRFNGHEFTVFTVANTPALLTGDISCLFEDRDGRLWIGTDGEGIFCYDRGEFTTFSGEAHKVTGIAQFQNGDLIVATATGAYAVQAGKWNRRDLPEADSTPTRFSFLAQDVTGGVWLTRNNRLYRVTDGNAELRSTFPAVIGALEVNPDGTVLCGLNNGHLVEIPAGGEPRHIDLGSIIFHSITRTRNGELWITTQTGLIRQRDLQRQYITTKHGLTSEDVTIFFEDREGNLWVGTNGGGLNRLREKLVTVHSVQNGLPSNDATSVIQDNAGRIWVASFKGGVALLEDGTWRRLPLPQPARPDISSLIQRRDGTIWIGGHFYPHQRWSPDGLEPLLVPGIAAIRVFFEDSDNGLWIGSRDAGVEYRAADRSFRLDASNGLSRNMVTAIVQDTSGTIWIGTSHGLNRILPNGVISYFREHGLGANGIYSLAADPDGSLWIGTAGGGLSRLRNGRFATLTTQHGLFSDIIGQLLQDDHGFLWMGTTAGIARVRKQDLHDVLDGRASAVTSTSFGKSEGLLNPESNNGFQPTALKARDGTLWFCTIGGLVVIDPMRITRNLIPPPVTIERLGFDHRSAVPKPIHGPMLAEIQVPPGTVRLDFHYAGLSFVAPEKVRFRYYLEGYDSDWVEAGSRRTAHYTRVPPGAYQFHVMAANNDGVWNENPAVLPVRVKPYYWQTGWFRSLVASALIAALTGALWMRISHLRRVHQLRLQIANDLHDEAGSNLGTIQLLSRRAEKRVKHDASPLTELGAIHRITAETAESIRNVVWLIDPQFDSLHQMVRAMENVAARLLGETRYDTRWNVGRAHRSLSLRFRSHFFLLFKEALHNIQKHARATRVLITLDEQNGFLILTIQDDGTGFDLAAVSDGHGIRSMQNRAAQLNGTLEILSKPGHGTRLTLKAKPS